MLIEGFCFFDFFVFKEFFMILNFFVFVVVLLVFFGLVMVEVYLVCCKMGECIYYE